MSASSSTSVSNSNSSKRTHDDMEAENKEEDDDENKDDHDEVDDNISDLDEDVDMDDDNDDAVEVDAMDDEDNDSNNVLDNTSRKGMKWTAEEDAIILREIKDNVKGYATRAAKCLEGRSVQDVYNRWHHHLKNHHADVPVQARVKWTAEEDAIILRERENKVYGYVARAAKRPEGRSVQAVNSRWYYHLKNHHAAETQASTDAPKIKKRKESKTS